VDGGRQTGLESTFFSSHGLGSLVVWGHWWWAKRVSFWGLRSHLEGVSFIRFRFPLSVELLLLFFATRVLTLGRESKASKPNRGQSMVLGKGTEVLIYHYNASIATTSRGVCFCFWGNWLAGWTSGVKGSKPGIDSQWKRD
jgi:hypothetical protein